MNSSFRGRRTIVPALSRERVRSRHIIVVSKILRPAFPFVSPIARHMRIRGVRCSVGRARGACSRRDGRSARHYLAVEEQDRPVDVVGRDCRVWGEQAYRRQDCLGAIRCSAFVRLIARDKLTGRLTFLSHFWFPETQMYKEAGETDEMYKRAT
jgi:hypothetical protein